MPDHKCYVCKHALTAGRPVLYVCREDGDLVLACGSDDHDQSTSDWKVVHPKHLLEADDSLNEVVDLREGEQADRVAVGAVWVRGPIEA